MAILDWKSHRMVDDEDRRREKGFTKKEKRVGDQRRNEERKETCENLA